MSETYRFRAICCALLLVAVFGWTGAIAQETPAPAETGPEPASAMTSENPSDEAVEAASEAVAAAADDPAETTADEAPTSIVGAVGGARHSWFWGSSGSWRCCWAPRRPSFWA